MFTFQGIIYGAPFHMQTDPDSFCTSETMCEGQPDPAMESIVRAAVCGIDVSGLDVPRRGSTRIEASPVKAAGSVRPSANTSPRALVGAGSEPVSEDETPEQKADRLREDRRDQIVFLGALIGGFAVGLWVEGK